MADVAVGEGDRVRLDYTNDLYTRLRPGDEGVVTSLGQIPAMSGYPPQVQVWIRWDKGGTLALVPRTGDRFTVIAKATDDA